MLRGQSMKFFDFDPFGILGTTEPTENYIDEEDAMFQYLSH